MAEEQKKKLLKDMLGLSDATAFGIGGTLTATGLIGALLSNPKTFASATRGVQEQAWQILPGFDAKADVIKKGMAADFAGYEKGALNKAQAGLDARGIADSAVGRETAANVKSGLSGAYAAASAALGQAKLNARSALSGAMSRYYQDLAEKQYRSQIANAMGKAGIWGALGGLGVGLLGMPSNPKKTTEKEEK